MAYDAGKPNENKQILIIGSGFAGLCMAIKLREQGIEDFQILERGDDVGGTWRDNHYPGCACDVQSHLYSFSFEPNPEWTRMFARQPEIKAYLEKCAAKYDLRRHIVFGANVQNARYDEATATWTVKTADGRSFSGRVLVSGMGGLSNPAMPNVKGLDSFKGKAFHSAHWDHGYDLSDKRVAVIGTGASAIQFVPQIQKAAKRVDLYQRTAPWIMPKPDREIGSRERRLYRALPALQNAYRTAIYWMLESRVLGFAVNPKLMTMVEGVARGHIKRQIKDPALRAKVTPDYTIGCKRILISNDYYPALAQANVDVITDDIVEVRANSVVDSAGNERVVDAIIYGTGFKAQDPMPRGTVFGNGGVDLLDAWKTGPEAYLGLSVAGFPNFFMLVGPNTGLGHNSMVFMIESQVAYVMDALRTMRKQKLRAVDVKPDAQVTFNESIQGQLSKTVWTSGCKSWYVDANGKNTTLWPGFTFIYRGKTRRFPATAYRLERDPATVTA
ncbi:NAD(P)/FAD-dependent oxidoreductase [uncultured Nevskia sp.]|uniref:flavin-containing monooxygenase n=1 Tax=uncultured Nevskia sp. TaxID=228950 RepID=UPI0025CC3CE5|nr:NAD(P)/FAD-dependent oxidoreductase [uncultured Nevskia sp.]